MTQPKLKLDLKNLSKKELVENLSKHLTAYEERWKQLMKEFDVKSRDARERSRTQWERFSKQIRDRRSELEKRVTDLFQQETQKLSRQINQGANELFNYLKSIAKNEKLEAKSTPKSGVKKKGSRASGDVQASGKKKASAKAGGRKSSSRKKAKAEASAPTVGAAQPMASPSLAG